jgi:hypothetical protein
LSIVVTKFDGSIVGEYLPWIGASWDAELGAATLVVELPPDDPHPLAIMATSATVAMEAAAVNAALALIAIARSFRRLPRSSPFYSPRHERTMKTRASETERRGAGFAASRR